MDSDPEDQEIIKLLTKLKEAEGEYPEQMRVERRRSYLKRMGEISLGIPAATEIKNAARDIKPTNLSSATSTIVETALVVAIIAEASTMAYFYRDQLTDFFRRTVMEPRVQEVTPPPTVETSLEIQQIAPSPALSVTVPSAATWSLPSPTGIAVTPSGTPMPGVVENNSLDAINTGEANLLNSTPGPNDSSLNSGNNGNHYGQTPKPERTKENGNNPPPKDNHDNPPEDNEDKPPKEDKLPKDSNDQPPKEDKPPKKK